MKLPPTDFHAYISCLQQQHVHAEGAHSSFPDAITHPSLCSTMSCSCTQRLTGKAWHGMARDGMRKPPSSAAQDFNANVTKGLEDYQQLFGEFQDLLSQGRTGISSQVFNARTKLSREAQQAIGQGRAVLVLPCRDAPLRHLLAGLERGRPSEVAMFMDEADSVWRCPFGSPELTEREGQLYTMFRTLDSLMTWVQVHAC